MTNPLLSIIIPTWNTADITKKCVYSILRFLPSNFAEIIVVDNGSTDDTQELFINFKNIKYIRNSSNLGFSKANNIGAHRAGGDYFLFLNSDMELSDDKLIGMLDFYRQNSDCGLIGPQFLNPDLTIQGSVFPDQSPINAFKEFWLRKKTYSKYYPFIKDPVKVWAISGGAILISRDLFFKIGEWNEKYFMFFEDLDICRQVRKWGKSIYYYPDFKVIHRHGASGAKLADYPNQWRRLIPPSKLYHGLFWHYFIFIITWSGQKWQKFLKNF